MSQFRHGDLLIVAVDALPAAEPLPHRVLHQSAATGHTHALEGGSLFQRDGELYFRLEQPAELVHQEHAALQIPQGNYLVQRQREYVPAPVSQRSVPASQRRHGFLHALD